MICLQRYKIYWINASFLQILNGRDADRKVEVRCQHTIRVVDPCFLGIVDKHNYMENYLITLFVLILTLLEY